MNKFEIIPLKSCKPPKKRVMTTALTGDDHARLHRIAKAAGESVSEIVRQMILHCMKDLD